MTREGYLKDEFATFANIISSLIRDRSVKAIYMLANTVNKYCPYFEEMGLYHIPEQEQGTIELYTYNNEKLTVAVEYCAAVEATKDVEHYYAFDNPQLDMITSGNWEEARYRRIDRMEFVANDSTRLAHFYIDFNKRRVMGEVHRDSQICILLFHWDTKERPYKDNDIVYTDKDCYSRLWQNSINGGTTKLHKLIKVLMQEGKDYYSSNAVGEVVNNFIKYSTM